MARAACLAIERAGHADCVVVRSGECGMGDYNAALYQRFQVGQHI